MKEGEKMAGRIAPVIIVGLIVAGVSGIAAEPEKEKAAVAAAENWVALVDVGKYADSWKESAEYFRNAVKQGQRWAARCAGISGLASRLVFHGLPQAVPPTVPSSGLGVR